MGVCDWEREKRKGKEGVSFVPFNSIGYCISKRKNNLVADWQHHWISGVGRPGGAAAKFPVYEVAVDLWSNTIAMEQPFPYFGSLFRGFEEASDVWKRLFHGNSVGLLDHRSTA